MEDVVCETCEGTGCVTSGFVRQWPEPKEVVLQDCPDCGGLPYLLVHAEEP
jgi:DnaJ-class molecular chaperone